MKMTSMNKLTTMKTNIALLVALLLAPLAPLRAADAPGFHQEFPGVKSDHYGAAIYSVPIGKETAKVICPEKPAPGRPWVLAPWYYDQRSPVLANMSRTQMELVKRGFHIVVFGLGNIFGAPDSIAKWDDVYREMTGKYGLSKHVALMGLSREGLSIARWAAANPGKVSCLYMDKGVCDFKSWPGGKLGFGKGSPKDWASLIQLYHFKSEAEALAYDQNPVDLAPKLVAAKVAILYIMGEKDDVVPYAENGARIEEQYKKLGGEFQLIRHEGEGHWPHGLKDPTPVVDFIQKHAR